MPWYPIPGFAYEIDDGCRVRGTRSGVILDSDSNATALLSLRSIKYRVNLKDTLEAAKQGKPPTIISTKTDNPRSYAGRTKRTQPKLVVNTTPATHDDCAEYSDSMSMRHLMGHMAYDPNSNPFETMGQRFIG